MTSFNHKIGPSIGYGDLSAFMSRSEPAIASSSVAGNPNVVERKVETKVAPLLTQKESIPIGKMTKTTNMYGVSIYNLHHFSYVLGSRPERESTFKKLYGGGILGSTQRVYALVGDPRSLEHEVNIVRSIPPSAYLLPFLDYAKVNNKLCYIFVPLKNQGNLLEYRAKLQRRTPITHLKVVRSIVRGLCHLHRHGIAHLDIKPENILVDVRKNRIGKLVTEIQITDFGMSHRVDDNIKKVFALGTDGCRSPEQTHSVNTACRNRDAIEIDHNIPQECLDAAAKVTTASDIYSLSIAIMSIFTSTNPKIETKPYWDEEWGTSSPLRNTLPEDRPTAEECLEYVVHDISNLRKERNKLEKK